MKNALWRIIGIPIIAGLVVGSVLWTAFAFSNTQPGDEVVSDWQITAYTAVNVDIGRWVARGAPTKIQECIVFEEAATGGMVSICGAIVVVEQLPDTPIAERMALVGAE